MCCWCLLNSYTTLPTVNLKQELFLACNPGKRHKWGTCCSLKQAAENNQSADVQQYQPLHGYPNHQPHLPSTHIISPQAYVYVSPQILQHTFEKPNEVEFP